jgi:hypothetical protein
MSRRTINTTALHCAVAPSIDGNSDSIGRGIGTRIAEFPATPPVPAAKNFLISGNPLAAESGS